MKIVEKLKNSLSKYFNKVKNIPNNGKNLSLFIIMFLVLFSYYYFITDMTMDEVWNYGFSYNIAQGLIPYKDFNMVILPFFQLINAFFLKIFGIKLVVYHMINALFITSVLYLVHKKIGILSTFCLLFYILLNPVSYGYNTFVSIILILILYLEKSDYKYKNEIIGLLIGSVLVTKQNIGLFMLIPYLIISRHKIKSILFTMIIPALILLYLLITNSLLECIDYCFLGLSNFTNNVNIYYQVLAVLLIVIGFLVYKLIKTKDKNYLYLLFCQGACYPIVDPAHFYIGFIPVVFYIFLTSKNYYVKLSFRTFAILFLLVITCIDIFGNGIYLSKRDTYTKYRRSSEYSDYYFEKITNYIKENEDKRIFIFEGIAYAIRLDLGENPSKFDLINEGNMGSNPNLYIEKLDNICKENECQFILNESEFEQKDAQISLIFRDYVLKHYEVCDSITPIDKVYCLKVGKE